MISLIFKKRNHRNSGSEGCVRAPRLPHEESPISLCYQGPGPYTATVSPASCRSNFFGWHAHENPFVKTILEGSRTHSESTLSLFYKKYETISVGDLFKIKESRISSAPAMSAVMPWWRITPEERLKSVAIANKTGKHLGKEAIELGANPNNDYGWQYFGPTSNQVVEIEFSRQLKVYRSIKENGYKPNSHLSIHGEFLVANERWCWINQGGKHRFNSLVALGHDQITISAIGKYGPLVARLEDAEHWPNVKNGTFTLDEARGIFLRILTGRTLDV